MNITDVGHMTDDTLADGGGEDKMALAARRLQEAIATGAVPQGASIDPSDPTSIADFYTEAFLEDARRLGMKVVEEAEDDPSLMPRPTAWIAEMIELVERLIAGGNAYVGGDGAVYFAVESFPDYGRLSGNTIENLREGSGGRIAAEHQTAKRHPGDFLLWKPDPTHVMRWPSPWGDGYPGWHLECSAMALGLLGGDSGTIDLHSGGEDNIFPHHECEVAQSLCRNGRRTVRPDVVPHAALVRRWQEDVKEQGQLLYGSRSAGQRRNAPPRSGLNSCGPTTARTRTLRCKGSATAGAWLIDGVVSGIGLQTASARVGKRPVRFSAPLFSLPKPSART